MPMAQQTHGTPGEPAAASCTSGLLVSHPSKQSPAFFMLIRVMINCHRPTKILQATPKQVIKALDEQKVPSYSCESQDAALQVTTRTAVDGHAELTCSLIALDRLYASDASNQC